ncbi:autotransporter outer membrane beta-barrel domain-containing protein [Salinicola rhizosphaerae]|uniref:Autotransporter domain-containing protein n=1 Tax=Salinicola rhizosphaerae TaxID=1443141 RepID=A0ABQ3DSU6_9GAMM|nr:autotransporter outer membrane beta-barrel domain-containing protein [Salinicola rhizosphaerae]GHB11355.1 hypothetical protein GCM10009038_06660 [Salinicola rhizosphaerae]
MTINTRAAFLGLALLTTCQTALADGFSLSDLIQIGEALPDIETGGDAAGNTQATLTLSNGREVTVSSPDGVTPLSQLVANDSSNLDVDGTTVNVSTDAGSLSDAYDNSGEPATFSISSIVETRPVTLSWTGSLDETESDNVFDAELNGQPITLTLPEGTTLSEFKGSTPITLTDAGGNVLIDDASFNSLSSDELLSIASQVGMLDTDMALRGAQKQAMAQNFGIIANQINAAMQPGFSRYDRNAGSHGLNLWVASEASDLSGQADTTRYDGDGKAAFVGVDKKIRHRYGSALLGLAAGHSEVDISTYGNAARVELGGNVIAPYAAIDFGSGENWGSVAFDVIGLYQELDGNSRNRYLTDDIDLDGDRWGARASGTYFLPTFHRTNLGLTAGGAYLDDKLDGTYLGTRADYGIQLGEVFGGLKLSYQLPAGQIYASALYYRNVTADVDSEVNLIENDDKDRNELRIGASHSLGHNLDFNISGLTIIGDSDTEYSKLQATLAYQF